MIRSWSSKSCIVIPCHIRVLTTTQIYVAGYNKQKLSNYKLNMEINKELRFRIYYGYSPSDYLCIKESELERAKYAWQTGSGFSSGTKTVSGSEFKRIEEDFRYYTGWYDTYNPKEKEDMLQIQRDMPDKNLFEKRLSLADNRVKYILRSGKIELLQSPEKVDTLLLN